MEVSTVAAILLRTPVTSSKASDKITSLSDLINESLAPIFTMPIVITSSSRESICALVDSRDQVRRRLFLTLSITSGHILRKAEISIEPDGLIDFSLTSVGFTSCALLLSALTCAGFACAGLLSAFGSAFTSAATAAFGSLFSTAICVGFDIESSRSSFSTLASRAASSEAGNKIRPQINSKINLGGVAPPH